LGFVAALQDNYQEAGLFWHKALGVMDDVPSSTSTMGFGGNMGTE
jgi:hypothetical protein